MTVRRDKLSGTFRTNTWLLNKHAEGLSQADSLARLPVGHNHFNHVLGHMVQGRDALLELLGAEATLSDEARALYARGAELVKPENAVALSALLSAAEETAARLDQAIHGASDERLVEMYNAERNITIADRIEGVGWHETYHLGQLEILRLASGDKPPFP